MGCILSFFLLSSAMTATELTWVSLTLYMKEWEVENSDLPCWRQRPTQTSTEEVVKMLEGQLMPNPSSNFASVLAITFVESKKNSRMAEGNILSSALCGIPYWLPPRLQRQENRRKSEYWLPLIGRFFLLLIDLFYFSLAMIYNKG